MNILSYKPFAHTESMQDIKLQPDNEYEKIMSQFSLLSPINLKVKNLFQNTNKPYSKVFLVSLAIDIELTENEIMHGKIVIKY